MALSIDSFPVGSQPASPSQGHPPRDACPARADGSGVRSAQRALEGCLVLLGCSQQPSCCHQAALGRVGGTVHAVPRRVTLPGVCTQLGGGRSCDAQSWNSQHDPKPEPQEGFFWLPGLGLLGERRGFAGCRRTGRLRGCLPLQQMDRQTNLSAFLRAAPAYRASGMRHLC